MVPRGMRLSDALRNCKVDRKGKATFVKVVGLRLGDGLELLDLSNLQHGRRAVVQGCAGHKH